MSKTLTHPGPTALKSATDAKNTEPTKELRSSVDELIEKAKDFSERNAQDAEDELLADFQYD